MKDNLLQIVKDYINASVNKDAELAIATEDKLMMIEPIERYYILKGIKLGIYEIFDEYYRILYSAIDTGSKSCKALLKEIYTEDKENDRMAYNGMGSVFNYAEEIKNIFEEMKNEN